MTASRRQTLAVNKWVKRALIAIPVLIALVYGPILIYANWINDPDPELDTDDAMELAAVTVPAASDVPGDLDGAWQVASGSEFGYRVEEILGGVNATATGRGTEITGSVTIDGATVTAAEFTVQVASIESDNGMRDQQFRGRVMDTAEFPTATFLLTEPIALAAIPPVDGTVQTAAVGELTMHGVTRPVTLDIEAVRGPQRIAVVGSVPIVFEDYEIENPSNINVTTEDEGVLEFNLGFERTTSPS